ncbi:uncharacterized protein TNCV_1602231 [Trichonephila clavipes]|nr:uncharacterized protein TNCV_1602231 [Trichonephila clavipes]
MAREGAFHHLIIVSYPRQDKRSKGNGCAIQHDFILLTVRKKLLVWLKNGVSPWSLRKKDRKVRQFFNDLNADEKLQDRERLFEVDVDVITTQLKNRFEITSAMAERSFSKLKLIKNYLRCTMSEERLSYLSLISIEQQEARKIELDELITDFAKKNTEDNDLPSAMEFLKNRKDFFKDLRLDTALNEMLCDAQEFPDEIDIPVNFELTQPRHRVRRRNVNCNYEAREDPIEYPTLKYKAEFFIFSH